MSIKLDYIDNTLNEKLGIENKEKIIEPQKEKEESKQEIIVSEEETKELSNPHTHEKNMLIKKKKFELQKQLLNNPEKKQQIQEAQEKLNQLFDIGQDVLQEAAEWTKDSCQPREVEAFAKLLDTMSGIQEKVIDGTDKKHTTDQALARILGQGSNPNNENNTTNNNLVVTSMRELNEAIKNNK
jgi:hypothetical protein